MTNAILGLLAIAAALGVLFGVLGWLADAYCERRRPYQDLPRPQRRAVVGQSHKPWM